MYKMGSSESYSWPVKIILPTDDGKTVAQDFKAVFRRIKQTEIDGFLNDVAAGKTTDREIVKSVMVGWKDIIDESGNQIPFTDSLLDQVLEPAGIASQIGSAFLESLRAGRVKN
jgi:hypothetical protein